MNIKANSRLPKRSPADMPSDWIDREHVNPIVRKCISQINRVARRSYRHAKDHIVSRIGALAECPQVQAHLVSLFLLTGGDKLVPITGPGHPARGRGPLNIDDEGLVPKAAREQKTLKCLDVDAEEDYFSVSDHTTSEIVIPLVVDGALLAVLNLEFRSPDLVRPEFEDLARQALSDITLDVQVLLALRDRKNWNPWNPRLHGWELHEPLTQLLRSATECTGEAACSYSIWYGDWTESRIFAIATHAYDWEFTSHSLPMKNSAIGQALLSDESGTASMPIDSFLMHGKARALGVREAYVRKITDPAKPKAEPIGAITCYARDFGDFDNVVAECDREIAVHAMEGLGTISQRAVASYTERRVQLAKSYLSNIRLLGEFSSRKTRFEQFLRGILTIFNAPAGSIFLKDAQSPTLKCIVTTGFYDFVNATRCHNLDSHVYHLEKDQNTHTVTAFFADGKPVRRNHIGRNNPDSLRPLPFVANRLNAEFIAGEQLRSLDHSERKLLLCSFGGPEPAGVIRVVRGQDGRLFNHWDEELLAILCRECIPEIRYQESDSHPIESVERALA